jgi:hypothetical protein
VEAVLDAVVLLEQCAVAAAVVLLPSSHHAGCLHRLLDRLKQ